VPSEVDWEWRPDHDGLRHEFLFDPLHYGVRQEQRASFAERVAESLACYGFVLTGEVVVRWELFVDEQDRLETPGGADVDNFAKLLNDSIKGPRGILVDDSQIQRLEVAWLSTHTAPYFELTIQCMPDAWSSKPISLYELSEASATRVLWKPCTIG
jgi:hypothetical protein